jgi:hypothetical protein
MNKHEHKISGHHKDHGSNSPNLSHGGSHGHPTDLCDSVTSRAKANGTHSHEGKSGEKGGGKKNDKGTLENSLLALLPRGYLLICPTFRVV